MREVEGVPEQSGAGRFGRHAPLRRRHAVIAVLALVAAGAAMATAAESGALAMRPVSSAERFTAGGAPHGTDEPSATAAAIAVAIATAAATGGASADPTAASTTGSTSTGSRATGSATAGSTAAWPARPTPGAPDPTPPAKPVPCIAAQPSDSVHPCPPPCRYPQDGQPNGVMLPRSCPPPPPPCMQPMASSPATGAPVRPCPPPPCRWTEAGSDTVTTGPCPPPCSPPAAAPAPGSASPAMVVACPPQPGWVMLTESDAGRTITVRPGTRILVRLSDGGVWTEPQTSDGTVVTRISSAHDPQGGAGGEFRAARAGKADLTATDSPRCAPQCKVMSRLWVVHIVVA